MARIPGPEDFPRAAAPRPAVADTTADDRALGNLADTVLQIGTVLKERRQSAIDSGANAQFISERRARYTRIFNDTPVEGDEPYAVRVQRALDKAEEDLLETVKKNGFDYSQNEKQRQQERAATLKGGFLTQAVTVENNNNIALVEREAGNAAQNLSLAAFNQPDALNDIFKDIEDTFSAYQDVPGVTLDSIAGSIEKAKNNATVNAVKGLNNTNPSESLRRLTEGVYDPNLTAEQKDSLMDQAQAAIRSNLANNQAKISSLIKDEIVSLERTGIRAGAISDDQIEATYPERAGEIFAQFKASEQSYQDRKAIAFATPEEVTGIIESRAPSGVGFADEADRQDALRRFAQERFKRLGIGSENPGDPVGYILEQSPELAEGLTSEDPKVIQRTTSTLVDMQRRLGVPEARIQVLSAGQAKQIVTQLEGMKAEDRSGFLAGFQNTYDSEDFYRVAYSQLVDAGLSAESMVLAANIHDPLLSQQLATLVGMDSKELRSGVETATLNDIGRAIIENTAEFFSAFQAGDFTGGSIPITDKWQSVIEKLAILKFKQTGDASQAVKDSVKQVIDDNYDVIRGGDPGEGKGFNAYVPRVLDGVEISAGRVEQVAIDRQDINLIREFNPAPISDPRSPDFVNMERVISTAARSGFWVTNEKGDGLMLMLPMRNGTYLPLINNNGERYEVGFVDAMKQVVTSEQQARLERETRLFPAAGL